jgi:predicted RNase H-related nuclease YkuK (DUF458 family)
MEWREMGKNQVIDLVPYIRKYLREKPDTKIWIGCDSQVFGARTKYAICVALHTNRGGHLLYSKLSVPRQDQFSRLMKEVNYTIELGTEIAEGLFLKRDENGRYPFISLHLDLNPDHKFASNKVLLAVLGWGESLGFEVFKKPNSPAASKAADMLVKQ